MATNSTFEYKNALKIYEQAKTDEEKLKLLKYVLLR